MSFQRSETFIFWPQHRKLMIFMSAGSGPWIGRGGSTARVNLHSIEMDRNLLYPPRCPDKSSNPENIFWIWGNTYSR
jgi:hypothetical protein